jgi:hypothetical protein
MAKTLEQVRSDDPGCKGRHGIANLSVTVTHITRKPEGIRKRL